MRSWYTHPVMQRLFQGAMRPIPPRLRFGAAVLLASAAAPLVSRSGMFRRLRLRRWRLNTDREHTLHVILAALDRGGVTFTPPLAVDGLERLDDAIAARRGMLIVGPHTRLTPVVLRHLRVAGYDITAVSRERVPAHGTDPDEVPTIFPTTNFLLRVRDALRRGRLVFAMVDHDEPMPGVTASVDTASGTVHVSDALIRLAVRSGAEVAFMASRLQGGDLHCTIAGPRNGSAPTAEAVTGEFLSFVQHWARPAH